MSERHAPSHDGASHHGASHEDTLDREIGLRTLVGFVVGLLALVVVTGVLMWLLSSGLKQASVAADPPPPLLPEARQPYEPPGPRLQADPPADMAALKAEEERLLDSWGWTDEAGGLARVPVTRAMGLLVESRAAAGAEAAAGEGQP